MADLEQSGNAPAGDDPRAWFAAFVAGRDVPCPACGYGLRDLKTPVCPECGEDLVIGVHIAEPRVAVLVVGLVALLGAIGFESVVFVWGMTEGAGAQELAPLAVGLVVHAPAAWAWVRFRTRIRRWSWRWPLIGLLFVAAIVPIGVFLAVV